MKQLLLGLGFVAVFLFPAQPAVASNPVIVGEISGVEVCAQELAQCKAAVFTGTCDCKSALKMRQDSFGFLCSMTRFRLLLPPHRLLAANGISRLCGAAFLVRCSMVSFSTTGIIHSQSLLDFVFKKAGTVT
jgi:hypothetical protein